MDKLPEDVRIFIMDVTLFIQSHRAKSEMQMDDMFRRAYHLYQKYDVEQRLAQTRKDSLNDGS